MNLCDTDIYTLQHSLSGLEPSYQSIKFSLFPVTIVLYPVVCKRLFIFTFIRISIKNLFPGAKNIIEVNQHKIVIIIEYKYSSYIFLSNLQVKVARIRKVLSCVEIIYPDFKDSKSKHEEILTVLQIVFLHGITNLSEKKMNNFNSHLFYKTSIKEPNFKHGVTLAMLKIVFFDKKIQIYPRIK